MKSIEFFPQRQLIANFTQGTHEAVDTGNQQSGVLQVWVSNFSNDGFGSNDKVDIFVQDAIENEEDFYSDSNEVGTISITPGDGEFQKVVLSEIVLPKRFLRLRVSPSLDAVTSVSVRAVLSLGN